LPKSLFVNPESERKRGKIVFKDIDLNAYQKTLKDIKDAFPADDLLNLFSDMRLIREFETMLAGTRTVKEYNGVQYSYTGPAHLYLGQEAVSVGQAYALDLNDYTFGNHRSHGEVIARGMSAIRELGNVDLYDVMKQFKDGRILGNVESFSKNNGDIKELAVDFFLYGFMTEIFGREVGFTGGLGNSMHVFFIPFGIYPNNAIVGAADAIGSGAALYKKLMKQSGICVVNTGDGALSTGTAWEAINFAAMRQYQKLWDDEYKGGLPVIFNFINNFYAMSGQTIGETMGFDYLARVGAAFNPDQLHAERIDGYNIFAVIDAFNRKKQLVIDKKGPVLLETITYRHSGHSVTDQNAYRTKEEMDAWMQTDALTRYKTDMIAQGLISQNAADKIEQGWKSRITKILKHAIDPDLSPRMNFFSDPDAIARSMFSNGYIKKMGDTKPKVIGEKSDNSRAKKIDRKSRIGVDENGNILSALKAYTYRDAIFEALLDKFYEDPTMIMFGEDIREHGNSFGVLQGLYESVPRHRMFNAPIAEASIISAAVGYAICGGRAVPEIMWCDFLGRCGDELFNQLAKWQGMSNGVLKMPCVVRVSVGAYYGAQHSQDWTSLCTHIPGLKVVYPASPYDAKGLLNAALCATDPVMFFESQKLYDKGEMFVPLGVPAGYYEVPIGKCDIKRAGTDITILTIGPALYPAMEAASVLQKRFGLEAEVIDTRTLVPFDYETVIESLKKTNRIAIVTDSCERGSYAKTVSSNLTEFAFNYLDAPPAVIGSRNWVSPCPELEKFFFPQQDIILDTIHTRLKKLPGYAPVFDVSIKERLRCEKLGI
jgi:2-oxoisovalerate dehydrogenase E1 component